MRFGFLRPLVALFSLMVAGTGCGKAPMYEVGEFAPYVETFQAEAQSVESPIRVDNIVIRFGDLANSLERAACEVNGDMTPTITVSRDVWYRSSEAEKEQLIYHELGHCVLYRRHLLTLDDEGYPVSIMHPNKLDTSHYIRKKRRFIEELFGR